MSNLKKSKLREYIVIEIVSDNGNRGALATNGPSWIVVKENDAQTSWVIVDRFLTEDEAREKLGKILA